MGFRRDRKGLGYLAASVVSVGAGAGGAALVKQAEIDRMRPVVEAAVEFSEGRITPEQLRHTARVQGYLD